jgi:AcrR family transcriptional regulator
MKPITDVKSGRSERARIGSTRTYSNALRREQADETRTRILEALVRTMSRGVAEVTMPAVAEEAGVSVPTVYRHFGSKRDLIEALGAYVLDKTGLMPNNVALENLDDLPETTREIYRRHEAMDLSIRAAMASDLGGSIRRDRMPQRLAFMRHAIKRSAPDLDERELERLDMLVVLLLSSATMRAMKDYFGLTGDDAAERIAWAAQTLIRGAQVRAQEG